MIGRSKGKGREYPTEEEGGDEEEEEGGRWGIGCNRVTQSQSVVQSANMIVDDPTRGGMDTFLCSLDFTHAGVMLRFCRRRFVGSYFFLILHVGSCQVKEIQVRRTTLGMSRQIKYFHVCSCSHHSPSEQCRVRYTCVYLHVCVSTRVCIYTCVYLHVCYQKGLSSTQTTRLL